MNFEKDLKKLKEIKAPDFNKELLLGDNNKNGFNSLIDKLKKTDRKDRKLIILQQVILFVTGFIILVLILIIHKIIEPEMIDVKTLRMGLIVLFPVYIISIYMYFLKFKKYNNIDYDKNLIKFLTDAKKRYYYFTQEKFLYIPLYLFLCAGLYFTLLPIIVLNTDMTVYFLYLGEKNLSVNIDKTQLFWYIQTSIICILSTDFFIKYLIWRASRKKIYDEVSDYLKQSEIL